ncbi:hypothetical protein CDAR_462901 [Caerostris darwini]|uniref:Uncharacterized protein n=1 Tax=Caerostris darwini TaxID=1538125 RepID=A0AAV4Q7P6_9ARAC|nr:hypothetical protein CDAR_462901 [Caerostris darwini]
MSVQHFLKNYFLGQDISLNVSQRVSLPLQDYYPKYAFLKCPELSESETNILRFPDSVCRVEPESDKMTALWNDESRKASFATLYTISSSIQTIW